MFWRWLLLGGWLGMQRTTDGHINHWKGFAESENIMFSKLTTKFIQDWISSLASTNRAKGNVSNLY